MHGQTDRLTERWSCCRTHCICTQCVLLDKCTLFLYINYISRPDLSVLCAAVPELSNKLSSSTSALLLARTSFSSRATFLMNSFSSSTAKSNASNLAQRSYSMSTTANDYSKQDAWSQHTGNNVAYLLSDKKDKRNENERVKAACCLKCVKGELNVDKKWQSDDLFYIIMNESRPCVDQF